LLTDHDLRANTHEGYKDSGADIAYVLKQRSELDVITPVSTPDPAREEDWVFGDAEESINMALEQGATHLWANTILFANHPLQIAKSLDTKAEAVRVIGQPPRLVELLDDKNHVNELLRSTGRFRLPDARHARDDTALSQALECWTTYPAVGKPVRGRGSHGVKVCHSAEALRSHCQSLFSENSSVIIEQYLSGQEATVTVMPPSQDSDYWATPVVERFNHNDGIAPYNGVVAVSQNSRCISVEEHHKDPSYREIQEQCVRAAKLLGVTAPIRIDVRRITKEMSSPFALFDVNLKPVSQMYVPSTYACLLDIQNMTGPGRKGREHQASLTAIAAAGIGWEYPFLLSQILASSTTLQHLRSMREPSRSS
jgi:hypothetical protein